MNPTGDLEFDALKRQELERELARLSRNQERRVAREKQKGIVGNSGSPAAASPAQSDTGGTGGDGTTPQKTGRGRNKDGTARKCANCGQVGHIKTNRKSVSFTCLYCGPAEFLPLDQPLPLTAGGTKGRKQDPRGSGTAAAASPSAGGDGGGFSAAYNYSSFQL